MAHEFDATVIITTYNQPNVLLLQLMAVDKQATNASYEVVVSDDGSDEPTTTVVQKFVSGHSLPMSYIRQPDLGFRACAARNNGIRQARGKLLIMIDGDMIPSQSFVQKHIEAHNQPRLIVAGNRMRRQIPLFPSNEAGALLVLSGLPLLPVGDSIQQRRQGMEELKRNEFAKSKHPWKACFSCNLSIPAGPEVFFDESFIGWGPEDWEFAYRMSVRHGHNVCFADEAIAYEVEEDAGVGNVFRLGTNERIVQYLRNTFYFYDKCPGLTEEEVFFGLPRLKLEDDNTWRVISRPDNFDLSSAVATARKWLEMNSVYTQRK